MPTTNSSESLLAARIVESGKTLAMAESCSGGLISHLITNISGASAFYLGGIVAYNNDLKASLLGVSPKTLAEHGAVSAQTACEMAEGVCAGVKSDIGLAVTGIAGPKNDDTDKPVGLVYIAVAQASGTFSQEKHFVGTREEIKQQTADAALRMLLEVLD